MERKISSLHLAALFVTTLVFIVGLLLGYQMGASAEGQMKSDFEKLRSESYALEVLSLMRDSGEGSCVAMEKELSVLSKETLDYGAKLEYMEKMLGKLDPKVMSLKSDYAMMQARNYLILKGMDKDCGTKHILIIYFYTNEGYSAATDQGIALDDALAALPEIRDRVAIYHFDSNVQNQVVAALKDQYGVSVLPTIIIDGTKHEGYQSAERCREILSRE